LHNFPVDIANVFTIRVIYSNENERVRKVFFYNGTVDIDAQVTK